MKPASLLSLFLLAGCAEPPAPLAPADPSVATAAATPPANTVTHDHLSSDTQMLGGTWVSVSLQRGPGKRPIVSVAIVSSFDPGVDASAVQATLFSDGKPLELVQGPSRGILPAAGNLAFGGGTSIADFTFTNAHGARLTEIEVTFNGETKRFDVASLKRFPEDFQAAPPVGTARPS